MNITWNGREVHNDRLRALARLTAGVMPVAAMALVLLCLVLMMLTWPVWVPLDWVLKRCGRRGFIIALGNGRYGLEFRPESFSPQPSETA